MSGYLHMRPGSLEVKTREHVRAGQILGRVGLSGDSLFPHLHFTVTEKQASPSQGVPSYFRDFTRILGSRRLPVSKGQIDTGDLLAGSDSCHGASPTLRRSK
jgi:murein DD-endopeptidase MepM/ murein hydrolase activator NlpD